MPSHQERRTPLDATYQFPTNRREDISAKVTIGNYNPRVDISWWTWPPAYPLDGRFGVGSIGLHGRTGNLSKGFNESDHE